MTMGKWNKDDLTGLIGTLAFHALILLLLWSCVLRTRMPEEEGGVLVNFGNVDAAAGLFEPKYTGQELPQETTPPPPPETQPETPKEEMITQNIEESVSIDEEKQKKEEDKKKKEAEEKKRKEEAEKERIRQEQAEKKRLAEEQRKKEQAIQNKVAGAFVSVRQKAITRAMLPVDQAIKVVLSVIPIMEPMRVLAVWVRLVWPIDTSSRVRWQNPPIRKRRRGRS